MVRNRRSHRGMVGLDGRSRYFECLNRWQGREGRREKRMRRVKGEPGQTVLVPAITFPFIIILCAGEELQH